jgi:propionyl-CoA carboxylase beta chain
MPRWSAEYTAGNISFDVPKDFKKPYDMLSVINAVTDKDSFLPMQQDFAANIITGFGRIKGMCIGIVANQPNVLCGALDVDSSCKAARFISFCDSFNIPIITLTDTPGFLPGKSQEQKGILRHGAKLLAAYSGATVPKITVIIRKAVGGAYIAMNSNGIGADKVFAWENAKISVMDDQLSASFSKDEKTRSGGLERALETGAVSCVIKPCRTVETIAESLKLLLEKYTPQSSKKRFNIPQ